MKTLVTFILVSLCLELSAQENFPVLANTPSSLKRLDVQEIINSLERPEHLFHWSQKNFGKEKIFYIFNFNQWLRHQFNRLLPKPRSPLRGNKIALPTKPGGIFSLFAQEGNRLLYSWSNPIGGMGFSKFEVYTEEKSPHLILMKPRPDASISVYVSEDLTRVTNKTPRALNTDLVFHIRLENGRINHIEWILQNPEAIEFATDKSKYIRPVVQKHLHRFESFGFSENDFVSFHRQYLPRAWRENLNRVMGLQSGLKIWCRKIMKSK